jgi:hypothetical protein
MIPGSIHPGDAPLWKPEKRRGIGMDENAANCIDWIIKFLRRMKIRFTELS